MFKGKTAWFSSSVEKRIHSFWVSEGGALSDWRTADYLFSDDATDEDTKRIYESEDYVKNRATVFHSHFLSTCALRQSVKSVPIGHYVLPPVFIQNELRAQLGKFIWEKDEQVESMFSVTREQQVQESEEETLSDETEVNLSDETEDGNSSQEDHPTIASPNNVCLCCKMQKYPVNNISGYVHIDQMKKYSGELYDFLPSLHGHTVSRSFD
ncbi:telomere repeats-binding bouquet formation protein 2 isoform X1 [Misgurnus anguillicaudatus]|uniref:telomere repeats-binding bouquet formation protein 2 isoform X1 n=1 Tax=Misgurnus anguillicaudatus TaxID=75329 RepID=UPI003CCFCA38